MQHVLVDTNVLLLLLIGRWDRARITNFRRTREFSPADFDLLEAALYRYAGIVVTSSVLTELSNLMGNDFHGAIAESIRAVCGPLVERSPTKEVVLDDKEFPRLGYADVSILLALDETTVVLTDDVHLYLSAMKRDFEAINFNHLRQRG